MLSFFFNLIIIWHCTISIEVRQHKKNFIDYDATETKVLGSLTNISRFKSVLKPILVERIVNTQRHREVGEYLNSFLKDCDFHTQWDEFVDKTPKGKIQFRNLIATYNVIAPRRLILACHYDSKILPNVKFIGAIDSAVPCAMLLDLANTLKPLLKQTFDKDVTLQLLFLDGEEALVDWSNTDSLYGARHLAKLWGSTTYKTKNYTFSKEIERIDAFILLDLLGAPNLSIHNTLGHNTDKLYEQLILIEKNLKKLKLLLYNEKIFKNKSLQLSVQDDHIPFKNLGVPVMHLISYPFPNVWHTSFDNEERLDYEIIYNLNTILRVFVAKYLDIHPLNNYTN